MPHAAIVGMQRSGKTTLALSMARQYRRNGYALLVLDPHLNPLWQADWMTDDLEKFLRKLKNSRKCIAFVEETGDEGDGEKPIGRRPGFPWLFTQSHHLGHVSHYVSQYINQVPPVVRTNVVHAYLFSMGVAAMREWADQLAQPELTAMVLRLQENQFIRTGTKREPPRIGSLSRDEVRRLGLSPR